jgi:uncharacterized protein YdeI (YjbR/CyaY-like superfamily)
MPAKARAEPPPKFFRNAKAFRDWLEKHHDRADELWVGYWKKATGKPSPTWQESVDEALCFGWIDGIRKSIDGDSYRQRFTPRRPRSNWSNVNIARVAALTAEGRMRPTGLAAFERRKATGVYSFEQAERGGLDPQYEAVFKKSRKAWKFFQSQAPWYRRTASWWVVSAKKEETRLRRLETLVRDSAAGRRIGSLTTAKPK